MVVVAHSLSYRDVCCRAGNYIICTYDLLPLFSANADCLRRITVVSNVATVVMILSHSVPPILHAALTTPNAALTNAMACKVFIDIKFGDHTTKSLSMPARTQHHIFSTIQGELPVFRQEKSTTVNNDLIISGVRVTMGPTRDHLPADDPAPSVNQLA